MFVADVHFHSTAWERHFLLIHFVVASLWYEKLLFATEESNPNH